MVFPTIWYIEHENCLPYVFIPHHAQVDMLVKKMTADRAGTYDGILKSKSDRHYA